MRIIMNKHLFVVLVGFALLTSCTTPRDIAYFQDVEENQPIQTQNDGYIRFQKGDKLNIYVHSRDEQLQDLELLRPQPHSNHCLTSSPEPVQEATITNKMQPILSMTQGRLIFPS